MSITPLQPGEQVTFESLFGTEELRNQFPVPYHETWEVVDSTKITEYRTCPRKFFYKYVLGWGSIYPSIHLVFGAAWHEAHEYLTINGYSQENIDKAYLAFEKEFRKYFPEHMDEDFKGKTPSNARLALQMYVVEWALLDDYKNLHTELSLKVPIGNGRYIYCKIDAINEMTHGVDKGLIFPDDHKTSSRQMSYWHDEWAKRFQFNAYLHAMHCFYPAEKIKGLRVNGAFFTKTPKFARTWVHRTVQQLQEWVFVANDLFDRLLEDFRRLRDTNPRATLMEAFPPDDSRCFDYFQRCQFYEVCNHTQNPAVFSSPPSGFQVSFWDPRGTSIKWEADVESGKIRKVVEDE